MYLQRIEADRFNQKVGLPSKSSSPHRHLKVPPIQHVMQQELVPEIRKVKIQQIEVIDRESSVNMNFGSINESIRLPVNESCAITLNDTVVGFEVP
jgi:hypothetical protein